MKRMICISIFNIEKTDSQKRTNKHNNFYNKHIIRKIDHILYTQIPLTKYNPRIGVFDNYQRYFQPSTVVSYLFGGIRYEEKCGPKR